MILPHSRCFLPHVKSLLPYHSWSLSLVWFSRSVVSNALQPMDCIIPGFPVHNQRPELAQTQVHWVGDASQPSHPLSSPSPPAFNLSQHQGLFQWVSSSQQVAKVLEFQLQHQSFQWIFRTDLNFKMDWLDILGHLITHVYNEMYICI